MSTGTAIRVGTDVVAVRQVADSVARFGARYLQRVYTEHEISSCTGSPTVRAAGLAARFAAKEATIKVLRPVGHQPDWRSVEVRRDSRGWCTMALSGHAAALADQAGIADLAVSRTEPRYQENVGALKSVQPEDLSATQIDARLGACWLPVKDFEKFARELLGADDIKVFFTSQLGTWTVQAGLTTKGSIANTTDWGTNRASALELIEDALNLRTPTIYDTVKDGKKDKQVVNANSRSEEH